MPSENAKVTAADAARSQLPSTKPWRCRLPLRIDLRCWDAVAGLAGPVSGRAAVVPVCSGAMPMLCVRSAWLAILEAIDVPRGAAVLMSAWTIPAMWELVQACDLCPVPVDIDPGLACPTTVHLERAAASCAAAKVPVAAVCVAHLFGARCDLTEIAAWCHAQGVPLIEDAAQAYAADGWWGHAQATATLWSFGTIKTATAGGGAIAVVRDRVLRRRIAAVIARWPVQKRLDACGRLARTAALALLGRRGIDVSSIRWLTRTRQGIGPLVRGFPGPFVADRYRIQPHRALHRQLARALRQRNPGDVRARALVARRLRAGLPRHVTSPGAAASNHCGWVLPIRARHPRYVLRAARAHGRLAMQPENMGIVPSPRGISAEAPIARTCHEQTVFVPIDPVIYQILDSGPCCNAPEAVQ
ncbi:MAG: DegT/DnrJ/EryC1/StrS family aminotransferase, partial [Planctomycetota bacterium]